MVYYPQEMVNSFNTAIVWLYVLAGALVFVVLFGYFVAVHPQPMIKFAMWIKRSLGLKKVVKTVYSDKTQNYSGTEFLPIPTKAPTNQYSYNRKMSC